MHYLYKIINLLNHKVYIGQSIHETERWRQHKYFGRNPEKTGQYIHRAISKYGIENFQYEVIAMCRSSEDTNELEVQLINQYDSRNPLKGYNVASGGETPWNLGLPKDKNPLTGIPRPQETRKKISKGNSGKSMPKWSNERKVYMSKIMAGRRLPLEQIKKISNSNRGQIRSEETKLKMSVSHMGNRSRASFNEQQVREIKILLNNCVSIKEISEKFNSKPRIIRDIKNGKTYKNI